MTRIQGSFRAAIKALVRRFLPHRKRQPVLPPPEDNTEPLRGTPTPQKTLQETPQITPAQVESPSLSPSASTSRSTPLSSSPSSTPSSNTTAPSPAPTTRPVADFLKEAEQLLLQPVQGDRLRILSRQLEAEYREKLRTSSACMLPLYNHELPTGQEIGRFLCLDVGGSTLRVALIELCGRPQGTPDESTESMNILRMQSFKITPSIKQLEGLDFFEWMAGHIVDTVGSEGASSAGPLPMGLSWSFPIEQTSLRGGLLGDMGKGFRAADSLKGKDLGDIIQTACAAHGLKVELASIVNDSAAALLSQAYLQTSTRFGLILGTGVNMAVHLPVAVVGRAKFGNRPQSWFDGADHVLINTEASMFGNGALPTTRWDMSLKAGHPQPDFQPLEQMSSGYYLGEVCRFALIEATATAGLFGGVLPPSLWKPYALGTDTLSMMEGAPSLEEAVSIFHSRHPCSDGSAPTQANIATVRTLASLISRRSAALIAAAIYAMWLLKVETESECLEQQSPAASSGRASAELAVMHGHTVVAFNGSVIERYPGYLKQCQGLLNTLLCGENGAPAGVMELVPAKESSLLGAAVSLACLKA